MIGPENKLLGVIDIKELLLAEPTALLQDVMTEDIISLKTDDTMKDAVRLFHRYGFRALPLADEDEKLLGVITYRDVMNLTHGL